MSNKKVAIVHDYLHQFGGAEKCVQSWLKAFPEAVVYTTIFTPEKFQNSPEFNKAHKEGRIKTTWLQYFIPFFIKYFKHFFWLYPLVMSFVKIKNQDLLIISATYCGKNIKFENCKKTIFYCYTPTRFLHGLMTEVDRQTINPILRKILPIIEKPLKYLDLKAVQGLKQKKVKFWTISKYIQTITKQIYKADSDVVYPPVELDKFLNIEKKQENQEPFYFSFGRISFHKRIDLIIKACLELERELIIAGTTALELEMVKLKKIITDFKKEKPDKKVKIEFVGRISDEELNRYLAKARAFLFPGKEDFGIAPIEALASGLPVIAYKAGGALEYIKENQNGIFFQEQEVESLKQAILKFEELEKKQIFKPEKIKNSAKKFSQEVFIQRFLEEI
jgi:glycosyltransferase involved in cell wall biosynthesis